MLDIFPRYSDPIINEENAFPLDALPKLINIVESSGYSTDVSLATESKLYATVLHISMVLRCLAII